MKTNTPLVSVCVFTYNSGEYVRELLNSIAQQSYSSIELVVSDDCSVDNTVSIVTAWLKEHDGRFARAKIVSTERNQGVAGNMNNAISNAEGEWIKLIAGDDILLPDCISDNMAYVSSNPEAAVIFSKIQFFHNGDNGKVLTGETLPNASFKEMFSLSAAGQNACLINEGNFVPAPSVFYKKDYIVSHLYSDAYPFCEDWPQWTHLTKGGTKLHFFDTATVLYRVGDSLSHSADDVFVNKRYHDSLKAFFYAERYPVLCAGNPEKAERLRREFFLGELAIVLFNNKINLFSRIVIHCLKKYLGVMDLQ